MTAAVAAFALFAAVAHAGWNAILRSAADRLWVVTIMSLATAIVAIPACAILPTPLTASWPYLLLSVLLQLAAGISLTFAYRYELVQVYPLIRGGIPLFATAAGFVLTGETPTTLGLVGIGLVVAGIGSLAVGPHRPSPRAFGMAALTSILVAGFIVTDGLGARLAGNAPSYIAWVVVLYGFVMASLYVARGGRLIRDCARREIHRAIAVGALSLSSYVAIVCALALGPLGQVSALRETSVVFAFVIAHVFLKERVTLRLICAGAVVTLGAVCAAYR